tara:strand:- start:1086 stop:1367 length:282 start_codon:yes stop_codon:yes gene_type:complete
MYTYLKTAFSDWRTWWKAPTTKEDRRIAAICGAISGFCIGFLVRLFVGALPAPWVEFVIWGAGGAVVFASLGYAMPKPILLMSAPFVMMIDGA